MDDNEVLGRKIDLRPQVDITLQFPVDFDGAKIDTLTMRRPKVRDTLKAQRAQGGELEKGLALMADLCEVKKELLLEMDEIDLEKLQAQYLDFTGKWEMAAS
jgi:hypothetical protein